MGEHNVGRSFILCILHCYWGFVNDEDEFGETRRAHGRDVTKYRTLDRMYQSGRNWETKWWMRGSERVLL